MAHIVIAALTLRSHRYICFRLSAGSGCAPGRSVGAFYSVQRELCGYASEMG